MFTYKFIGLRSEDASTPYYYGSLPAKPQIGQIIVLDETGNRYRVTRVVGEGLKGKGGLPDQEKLAWADIGSGESVPTLHLSPIKESKIKFRKYVAQKRVKDFETPEKPEELPAKGRSFDAEEFKQRSRLNRKIRLKKPSR